MWAESKLLLCLDNDVFKSEKKKVQNILLSKIFDVDYSMYDLEIDSLWKSWKTNLVDFGGNQTLVGIYVLDYFFKCKKLLQIK